MKKYIAPLLSGLLGFSVIFLTAATTDQILQDVYNSSAGSLNVTLTGGVPASSITVGSTTISGGSTGQLLYDNGGTLGERANPLIVAAGGTGVATLTSHGVVVGQGTSAVAATAAGSSGQPLLSGGASADPAYGTLGVAAGGTGAVTLTNHGVLLGQTTSAIAATSAGTTGYVLTSNGASADPTFQLAGASTPAPVAILLPNAGTTGTTVNKLAKVQSAGTVIITATTDTVGALGIVIAGAGTTGSATIQLIGAATCVFDNAVTAGDFIGISSGTAGDCTDLGSTFPSDKSVLGIVTDTAAAGTRNVILQTPDIMNTTNIKGGNPGKGNITNLIYTGTLSIQDVHADSSNFTVAHRIHYVTTSTSTITATTPASPAVGDTYTVVKADSGSGTVVWTRAGSQTLNGATTRTVSAQYKSDTCIYMASNVWICQGDGA